MKNKLLFFLLFLVYKQESMLEEKKAVISALSNLIETHEVAQDMELLVKRLDQ